MRFTILVATVLAFTTDCFPQSGLPSFPGANGFGAISVGGRGGRVIFVTNRNNSGPGSFRSACEASGARIVIFQVGGTIQLTEEIVISNPYITIAGQTAPGGGICVKGELFGIQTHDVIVRNLRVRVGEAGTEFTHGMEIGQGSSKVIVDHCSFSWSKDALIATWDTVSNITVQESIISEVLSGPTTGHSAALGPGPGENEDGSEYLTNCSFIRNLIAHGEGRNPKVHYQAEVANNLVYNWENIACYASMYAQLDFIGNHYLKGPSSGNVMTITLQDPRPSLRIFVSDNRTPELPTGGSNQWAIVNASTIYQSTTRLHSSGYQPMSSTLVYDFVLDNAGAFPRDPVDLRIEADVRNGTGTIISNETQVGGFPVYPTGPPPVDSDSDGMPNTWETEHGLNPASALDANADRNGDGYLNIEEYINSLIEPQATTANAGPDQELCGSTTTTLAANTPLVGLGSWTVISGGGTVTLPNNPASTVTNMQIGVNVLSWKISHEGSFTRDTVRINVLQPTTPANAGSDQQICEGVPATLHGNVPAVGAGIWRTIDGPGIVTAPSNPNSGVTNLRLGFNVFEWKITGPLVCPEYRDTVSIFVDNLASTANAGGDRTLCSVSSTSLSGNQPAHGTGLWRVLSGSGILVNPSVYNTVVNNLQAGINLFEWTITNGACAPSRDTVSIFRQLLPIADFTWELNGLLVEFTSTSTNASTYQWSFGDGSTSTERNPIHLYTVFRSFRVAHSASNTCGTAYKTHRLNPLGARPMMEITPATVDFGNVQVGNSATRVITVFNGGTDSLDIESILADGSIAHAMSIKDQGFIIPPDNRRDILIQFTPPSGGNIDGQIIVAGFDTSASIRVLAKVTDLTLLKSDFLLPESFAFGYTEPGATARGVITLSNTTGEPLRIDSIRIAGNADQPFSIEGIVMPQRLEKKIVDGEANPILSLSQWNLAANDTLGISLAYLPTGQPGDSGSLLIFAASGLRTVALSGSGSNEDENATLDPVARGTHPDKDLPEAFSMEQNFPNPFNPATTIRYSIPIGGSVLLSVYNVLGQKVATLVEQDQEAGYHSVVWNAYQMSGGIYFYQLRSGGFTITKQLVLLK